MPIFNLYISTVDIWNFRNDRTELKRPNRINSFTVRNQTGENFKIEFGSVW